VKSWCVLYPLLVAALAPLDEPAAQMRSPDVSHVMMKLEYGAGLSADASSGGEKRLREFLAAVDALKISNSTYRVVNNVILPSNTGVGMNYRRNVVFTLTGVPAGERDGWIAKLQDLGARYNSHCVTCIGSG
jgi:hypothetical protein